jgi:hypothetical protein
MRGEYRFFEKDMRKGKNLERLPVHPGGVLDVAVKGGLHDLILVIDFVPSLLTATTASVRFFTLSACRIEVT